MTTPEHYAEMNNAPISSLSPWLASRELFQPKYTVGIDWGAPREQVSLAIVRSTRHMVSELPKLQDAFVRVMHDELDQGLKRFAKGTGEYVASWNVLKS
jgi:hypothetical protein